MGGEVNLLKSLPETCRNVGERRAAKTDEAIAIARRYSFDYFDGPREYGYGGYYYDGRWRPVAHDIVKHYGLGPGARVLDIGCAKGFLVADLVSCGIDAYGVDLSRYAVMSCPDHVVGRVHQGDARQLPFSSDTFDLVLSINTIHNLDRLDVIKALRQIERVRRKPGGHSFVQVDSYRTEVEQSLFEDWVLTAKFHGYPSDWLKVFKEAGYEGDYYWTLV